MNDKEMFNLIENINSLESKLKYHKMMFLYVAKLYEKVSLMEKNFNFEKASMCN